MEETSPRYLSLFLLQWIRFRIFQYTNIYHIIASVFFYTMSKMRKDQNTSKVENRYFWVTAMDYFIASIFLCKVDLQTTCCVKLTEDYFSIAPLQNGNKSFGNLLSNLGKTRTKETDKF